MTSNSRFGYYAKNSLNSSNSINGFCQYTMNITSEKQFASLDLPNAFLTQTTTTTTTTTVLKLIFVDS